MVNKPEDRLLTYEEWLNAKRLEWEGKETHADLRAQDAKTASLIRAERLDRPDRAKIANKRFPFSVSEAISLLKGLRAGLDMPLMTPEYQALTGVIDILGGGIAVPQGDDEGASISSPEASLERGVI